MLSERYSVGRAEYSAYVAEFIDSGRSGDNVQDEPEFFGLVYELEHDKTRHDSSAVLTSATMDGGHIQDEPMTRTSKLRKRASLLSLEESRNVVRHSKLLEEIRKGNGHRSKFNELFEKLVEKL